MIDVKELFRKAGRPLIMGIVNATGDSFSEGCSSGSDTALQRALALIEDGADILDVGGESTRPGSRLIPEKEELERIAAVIAGIKSACPEMLVSIDTRKSGVAAAAVKLGAEIINDVSMLRFSPALAEVAAQSGATLVLNHSRGTPQNMSEPEFCDYGADVTGTVMSELAAAGEQAMKAGVRPEAIVYDPGLGFAKTPEQDFELLRNLKKFHELGPVLAGFSRKSFLGKTLGEPDPQRRLGGTVAVALYLARQNVEILRVHDVRQIRDALRVQEILNSGETN